MSTQLEYRPDSARQLPAVQRQTPEVLSTAVTLRQRLLCSQNPASCCDPPRSLGCSVSGGTRRSEPPKWHPPATRHPMLGNRRDLAVASSAAPVQYPQLTTGHVPGFRLRMEFVICPALEGGPQAMCCLCGIVPNLRLEAFTPHLQ